MTNDEMMEMIYTPDTVIKRATEEYIENARADEDTYAYFFTPIAHLSTLTVLLYNEVKNGGADNERNKIPRISG